MFFDNDAPAERRRVLAVRGRR